MDIGDIYSLLGTPLLGIPVAILFTITIVAWMRKEYVWKRNGYQSDFRWRDVPLLLSPSLCYVLILTLFILYNSMYNMSGGGIQDKTLIGEISGNFLFGLFYWEVPLVLWVVWRMQGFRVWMLFLGALHLWYSFLTGLYASMSISGLWL